MNIEKLKKDYGDLVWYGKKRILGLPISFTLYVLTTNKLFARVGFMNIKEERIDLYRIVDLSLKLPLGQRMFGCGTIKVFAKDKSMPELDLASIKNPREALRFLEENIESERKKYRIHGRDMVGASSLSFDSGGDEDDWDGR